jgi:hypothetical protein
MMKSYAAMAEKQVPPQPKFSFHANRTASIMRKCPGSARGLPKFDVFAMGADDQSLDWALIPQRRGRGIFVERKMMKSERRRCDIIPG